MVIEMKKRYMIFLLMSVCLLMLAACGNQTNTDGRTENTEILETEDNTENSSDEDSMESTEDTENMETNVEEGDNIMVIEAGGQQFRAVLYDNDTAAALAEMLPMTLNMEEMNGNEKYYFMEESLPTASESIGTIQNGDIMLYGSDCLVLFFKTFDTSYTYTRIGYVEEPEAFAAALARGTVEISFYME